MTITAKFSVPDPGIFWSLQTVDQLDQYSFSAPQFEEIEDIYLDTKKRRLLDAGYYCRQRNRVKGCTISLIELDTNKTGQPVEQWQILLKRNNLDPEDWPESPFRKRVRKVISDKKLHPIFALHQTRITRLISKGDQVIARAALDNVTFVVEGHDQQFKTLKIGMMVSDDEENHLDLIIASLQAKWQLEIEPRSKFEQVIALESMWLASK